MGNGVTVSDTASVSQQQIIDSLTARLAKANERVEKSEKEIGRLRSTFHKWKQEKENAVWENEIVFRALLSEMQKCPTNEYGLSDKEWWEKYVHQSITKFAIEKKIEGAFSFANYLDKSNFSAAIAAKESGFFQLVESFSQQLRKEQASE